MRYTCYGINCAVISVYHEHIIHHLQMGPSMNYVYEYDYDRVMA